MRIYTVHVKETDRKPPDDVKAVAVREAFSVWAFLFRFLWAAANGAWISAAILLAIEIVLAVSMVAVGFDGPATFLLGLVWMTAVGLFARDMKRWELGILGYEFGAAVVAENGDDALRRYFAEHDGATAGLDESYAAAPVFREEVYAPPVEDAPRITARPAGSETQTPLPGPRLGPRLT